MQTRYTPEEAQIHAQNGTAEGGFFEFISMGNGQYFKEQQDGSCIEIKSKEYSDAYKDWMRTFDEGLGGIYNAN